MKIKTYFFFHFCIKYYLKLKNNYININMN